MQLFHGDCLELMKNIPDSSIDCIITDLPYGTTDCAFDTIIPFSQLWQHYWRICKKNAPIILFSCQPFTTKLISSNFDNFKYNWIWKKSNVSGFANAKKRPLKVFEDILVFSYGTPNYFPQGLVKLDKPRVRKAKVGETVGGNGFYDGYQQTDTNYPKNILEFANDRGLHPTQKPLALLEYLMKTYSREGEMILDSCMGSGTTGLAAKRLNRDFIGIEKDDKYFNIAKDRIENS